MSDIKKIKGGIKQCWLLGTEDEYETQCWDCPYFDPERSVDECRRELRKEAVEVLDKVDSLEKALKEKQKHLENLQKVNEELEERIAIMSEGGWIPVEKRLPDEDDPRGCLVVVHYDDPFIGEGDTVYSGIVGYSADSGDWVTIEGIALFDEVTHWQYAPEPPKEGEQE